MIYIWQFILTVYMRATRLLRARPVFMKQKFRWHRKQIVGKFRKENLDLGCVDFQKQTTLPRLMQIRNTTKRSWVINIKAAIKFALDKRWTARLNLTKLVKLQNFLQFKIRRAVN